MEIQETQDVPKYIFPKWLATAMSKVDLRTQYEASMMSMVFMLVGLIVTIVYFTFFFNFALWYKILLLLNGIAGLVFFGAYIITTYQQYQTYMEAVKVQEQWNNQQMKGGPKKE